LQVKGARDRLNRLTDAFLDGVIERGLFEQRKAALLMDQKRLEENIAHLSTDSWTVPERLSEFLELARNARLSYRMGIPEEKRDLLKTVSSNREMDGKNVVVKLSNPFCEVANRFFVLTGGPVSGATSNLDALFSKLVKWFAENPTARFGADRNNIDQDQIP